MQELRAEDYAALSRKTNQYPVMEKFFRQQGIANIYEQNPGRQPDPQLSGLNSFENNTKCGYSAQ